ncbi:MAG: HD domain-containing protein [Synergistes sp.]|nr:HD domain-containing protein [Synergistes sp.]
MRKNGVMFMYPTEKTEKWFDAYTDSFKTEGKLLPLQETKRRHSKRVKELACAIAEALEWNEENDMWLAHAAGLLHDVARFEQYRDYRTFSDRDSFDHGDRGAEILAAEFDWEDIRAEDREKLLSAVRFHNKKEIPSDISLSQYRWCALVRDADKIDVFRLVQYKIDKGSINETLPKFGDSGVISQELAEEVRRSGRGSYANAHSLQDFRLIQLTWALDLNYPVSVVTLKEERIFDKIAEELKGHGVDDIIESLMKKISEI